ncbi:hypothetical protein LINPERHAP1_LOCUS128 [Linum perenne]
MSILEECRLRVLLVGR